MAKVDFIKARSNRADFDYPEIKDTDDLPTIVKKYNDLVKQLSWLNKSLSLQSNFSAYIAENISMVAGETKRIQHFLGVKPKWRIILKQTGNGVITDVPSEWNDKMISLKNNGAETVVISVFISRE